MSRDLEALFSQAEKDCAPAFSRFERTERAVTARVLDAFERRRVAARHFAPSNGYGYGDVGRDTLEAVCADVFQAEEAILRPSLASGTHTLAVCLQGLLLPGDELLLATGSPYDTLRGVIGFSGEPGSLSEMGVTHRVVELTPAGGLDLPGVLDALNDRTRAVFLQRSRGYALRPSLSPRELGAAILEIKARHPAVYAIVDNCYGAFVTEDEPTFYGADAACGSLIKNLGGGLMPAGGYIAGTRRAVSRIENRLTAPGVGREIGSYEGGYRLFFQGLFLAPHTVCQALKTAALAARVAELLGYRALPGALDERFDVIQALLLGTPDKVSAYCLGLQSGSPVDAYLTPEPWDMPGYADPVIMAAGAFVQGASIELSCDAPMRPPYAVYQQGALTYESARRALKRAFARLTEVSDA